MTSDQRAELIGKLAGMTSLALAKALLDKINVTNNGDYSEIKKEVDEIIAQYED